MTTSLVKSVYVPDYCLEGTDLPAHILWDNDVKLKIRIKLESQLEVKSIFNVSKDNIRTSDNYIEIDGFEVNGYVAFIFVPHIGEEKVHYLKIEFEFFNGNSSDSESITKEVKVFRPKIKIIKVPKEIKVNFDKKANKWIVDQKIQLENEGEGTGLISFEIDKSKGAEILAPAQVDQFVSSFFADLKTKLLITSKKFEKYRFLIKRYLDFIQDPGQMSNKGLDKKLKSLVSEFVTAFSSNEDFRNEIAQDIYLAYISNVELITEMKSFLQYINSIAVGKILLTNSLDSLSTYEPEVEIKPTITLKDLSFNPYEPIPVGSIKIYAGERTSFPVHILFDWRQPGEKSQELKE